MSNSATGKATVSFTSIDAKALRAESQKAGGTVTLRHARDNGLTLKLALSDATLKDVQSMDGAVASAEYDLNAETKLKGAYDLGARSLSYGMEWNGAVDGRDATLKANYTGKVSGEASVAVNSSGKATLHFEDFAVTSAKYSLTQGDFTYEPSYNFVKQAPALSVSTSRGKDTFKASYCLKSETAGLEWNRKPYKVSLSSSVNASGVGKPSICASYEQAFDM